MKKLKVSRFKWIADRSKVTLYSLSENEKIRIAKDSGEVIVINSKEFKGDCSLTTGLSINLYINFKNLKNWKKARKTLTHEIYHAAGIFCRRVLDINKPGDEVGARIAAQLMDDFYDVLEEDYSSYLRKQIEEG